MQISYRLKQIMEIESISLDCYHQLFNLAMWLEEASEWASLNTHYQNLNDWADPLDKEIHKNLDRFVYSFFRDKNTIPNDVRLWFEIYQLDPCWSPNLVTKAEPHHSSAYERNQCLLMEINYLLEHFEDKIS